jgi:8-oxo-dGTP diphosphatase
MIRVLGTGTADAAPLVDFELAHGLDPLVELTRRGFRGSLVGVLRPRPGDLTLRYAVEPVATSASGAAAPEESRPAPDPAAYRIQRVAAYAVVRSTWGILLTELSDRTAVPGQWNLPGGGIEPDEDPVDGLVREIHEETSQRADQVELRTVLTRHWVGMHHAQGRLEDLHAVRIIYSARCREPSIPVVRDVGGSTAAARWTSVDELARLPLASSVADALAAADVVVPGG